MKDRFLLLACILFGLYGSLQSQNLDGTCWSGSTCAPATPLVTCFENDTMTTVIEPAFTFLFHYGTVGDSIFWVLDITTSCPDTGFYSYEIVDDMLMFSLIDDDCAPRVEAMLNCYEYELLEVKVGINENEVFPGLILYPNPVESTFTIDKQGHVDIEARLLDDHGRVVLETYLSLDRTIISVDHLSNGLYTLILMNGDQIRSEKIMILK